MRDPLNVLIIEADEFLIEQIKGVLLKCDDRIVSINVNDFETAYENLATKEIALIICNTFLKQDDDGIDFGRSIKNKEIPIAFICNRLSTASFEKAAKTNLYDFWVVPLQPLLVRSSIARFLIAYRKKDKGFVAIGKNRYSPGHILFVRADNNYCLVQIEKKAYKIRSTLKEMIRLLPGTMFLQIHRTFVVNIIFIEKIHPGKKIMMVGDYQIPIGRKYLEDFVSKINIVL